jgi:hypothetical protein
MKTWDRILVWTVAAFTVLGTASWAQEVEPPFTWKGKGEVAFVGEYGTQEVNFSFELSVDASGGIKGKTSSDEGDSALKHVFYGERVEHELPGYYSRKAIVVLMLNEGGSEPLVATLNGRLLAGRFFSGEALIKRYEYGSETDKALGVGNPMATQIDEDYLPSSLKSALKKSMPIGTVKIEGGYVN